MNVTSIRVLLFEFLQEIHVRAKRLMVYQLTETCLLSKEAQHFTTWNRIRGTHQLNIKQETCQLW